MTLPLPARVLAHLVAHIGDITPTDKQMSEQFGLPARNVANAVAALIASGTIFKASRKGNRHFYFRDHKGCTLPLVGETLPPPAEMPERERVHNFACPRCGVRNCERHAVADDGWRRFRAA